MTQGSHESYHECVHSPQDEMGVRRALVDVLPEGASVERVEFSEDGTAVTLWTQDVGSLLGRRGATADRIRSAIDVELHRSIQLNIGEVIPPDDRPPELAGVPLRPSPSGPSTTTEADSDTQ